MESTLCPTTPVSTLKREPANQDAFLMEDCDVICATIAFGMGIDKPDVRFIIHYDVPKSLGRVLSRDRQKWGVMAWMGIVCSFFNPKDTEKLEKFLKDKPVAEREIGTQLIAEMAYFAESSQCRRKSILHYFGENFDSENCQKMCDNCRHPRETKNATEDMKMVLEAVNFCDGKVGLQHVVDLLSGKASQSVKAYKHHVVEWFGKGKDKPANYWKTLIRFGQINNLIIKKHRNLWLVVFE